MRATRLREARATRIPGEGALAVAATEAPVKRASAVAAVISPGVAAAGWKMDARKGRDEAVMGRAWCGAKALWKRTPEPSPRVRWSQNEHS